MYLPFVGAMLRFTPYAKLALQYVPEVPHENTVDSSPVNSPVLEMVYLHRQYVLPSAYAFPYIQ
jgi:hypothetical protein